MPSSSVISIQSALETALQRIKANYQTYDLDFPTRGYPVYETAPNNHWVAGFWPGLLWLSYHATQDTALRTQAEALLPSFAERLEKQIDLSHDLGFLYTLSARAAWMLTGDQTARDLGIRAAQALSKRYNPRGNFIQAWGEIGTGPDAGRVIVDCMMNLPLLYWAAEEAGERRYYDLARQHAATTLQYLVRADGSTYHTYRFDPHTGQPLAGETRQGFADESLWTRGQAWAIYGFALTAQWTGEAEFLNAARDVAACFLRESPVDKAPLWDLRLSEAAPHYLDSSAGAIAACGLLRLAQLTGETTYRGQAETLLTTLIAECMEQAPGHPGLLKYGAQHVTEGLANEYLIYGDYYFLEAMLTLTGQAPDFWGPARDE